jgi:hypothetical protein
MEQHIPTVRKIRIPEHGKLSRPVRFRQHFAQQIKMIIGEVGKINPQSKTIAYTGNTTGQRSRKLIRKYAREAARLAMKAENA